MENTRQKRVANPTQNSRKWSTWRLLCILQLCGGESVEVVVTKMVRIQFGKIVVWLTIIGECRRLYMQDFTAPLPTNNSTMIIWIIWHCRVTWGGSERRKKGRTNNLWNIVPGIPDCDVVGIRWTQMHGTVMEVELDFFLSIVLVHLLYVAILHRNLNWIRRQTWMRRGLVNISSLNHSCIIQ